MKHENVPPQFQNPKKRPEARPLFEELPLPADLPDAAGELPAVEEAPPRVPDPYLRRS